MDRSVSHHRVIGAAELLPEVYDELHRMAHRWFLDQPSDHTLQPTALVNEAYLRLAQNTHPDWHDRTHFLAVAATAMRQILISHARRRNADKRGGGWRRIRLAGISCAKSGDADLESLHAALRKLEALSARQSRIVELRYFGGLTVEETARVVGVSPRTVKLDWHMARGWLRRQLRRDGVVDRSNCATT